MINETKEILLIIFWKYGPGNEDMSAGNAAPAPHIRKPMQ